jgi:PTS system galactitol-specific IIA component
MTASRTQKREPDMPDYRVFVNTDIHFDDARQALEHIGRRMLAEGVVKETYPAALLLREQAFPTGITLEHHAVAIPHCEACHALQPSMYLIRPDSPVPFAEADGDGEVPATLIIALIVTQPQQQLVFLRTLFGALQHPEFIEQLLNAPNQELGEIFNRQILSPSALIRANA